MEKIFHRVSQSEKTLQKQDNKIFANLSYTLEIGALFKRELKLGDT